MYTFLGSVCLCVCILSKHTQDAIDTHTQRGKGKQNLLTDKLYFLKNIAMKKPRLLNIVNQCEKIIITMSVLQNQTSLQVTCPSDLTEKQRMGKEVLLVTDL